MRAETPRLYSLPTCPLAHLLHAGNGRIVSVSRKGNEGAFLQDARISMWVPEDYLIEPLIDPESAPALALKEDYSIFIPSAEAGGIRCTGSPALPAVPPRITPTPRPTRVAAGRAWATSALCRSKSRHGTSFRVSVFVDEATEDASALPTGEYVSSRSRNRKRSESRRVSRSAARDSPRSAVRLSAMSLSVPNAVAMCQPLLSCAGLPFELHVCDGLCWAVVVAAEPFASDLLRADLPGPAEHECGGAITEVAPRGHVSRRRRWRDASAVYLTP
jgi:hypothetical protein